MAQERRWSGHFADACAILVFLLLSAAHVAGRWGGTMPFDTLTGDASFYADIAAARDSPELFRGDELLGDPRDTRIYTTVLILLGRVLKTQTGDYGTAFIAMLGPLAFVQLTGFYVFGRAFLQDRFWALLLALVTAPHLVLSMGDYWGFNTDVQPRFLFQAFWPFALAAAVRWSDRPRAWPWLLAGVGPLAFLHAVSAPALGLSLWLGFWACLPPAWALRRRLGHMFAVGFAFVLGLAPYLFIHLRGYARGPATPMVEEVLRLMAYTKGHTLDMGPALSDFVAALRPEWPYLAIAALGSVLLWRAGSARRPIVLLGLWAAGVLLIAIVVAGGLRLYACLTGTFTLDTQLPRNLRYLIPLLLTAMIGVLAEWDRRAAPHGVVWRIAPVIVGLAVTLGFWVQHEPAEIARAWHCLGEGRVLCPDTRRAGLTEAMNAVRDLVPKGGTMVATTLEGQIRYAALRPLVYAEKDYEAFVYSNHEALAPWLEKYKLMSRIRARPPRGQVRELVAFARRYRAAYVLAGFPVDETLLAGLPAAMVWTNQRLALLRVELP